jgi:retron-type reverse transcriptase
MVNAPTALFLPNYACSASSLYETHTQRTDYAGGEVRHVGAHYIPFGEKRGWSHNIWVTFLTWRRNPKGTIAWNESIFEPQFSDCSHGFRPGRGCHTALQEIDTTWLGTTWFVEGDIKACFDSLDHQILLNVLAEQIHDGRLLRLIRELLEAGYLEEWKYNATVSGAPQGGICSPILSNIYLNKLDKYMENHLQPAYRKGERRRGNPPYRKLLNKVAQLRKEGKHKEADEVRKIAQQLPSVDPTDPNYRRLKYVRYADDVRHLTRSWIPFTERRSSEETTSGSPNLLGGENQRGH